MAARSSAPGPVTGRATAAGRGGGVIGAAAGVAAAAFGLGVAEVLAAVDDDAPSPVVAMANRVIRLAPGDVARRSIEDLGTRSKPILVTGVVVAVLVLAGVAGHLVRRRRPMPAAAALAAVAVAGVWGVLGEPGVGVRGLVPTVVGVAVAVLALLALTGVGPQVPHAPLAPRAHDRRAFVAAASSMTVLGAVGALAARRIERAPVLASRRAVVLPRPAVALPPVDPGTDFGIRGVEPYITPFEQFYRIDVNIFPLTVPTDGWTLRIRGMVDRELVLDYDDLLARPMVEADVTLVCVSNEVGGGLVGNARWLGVPLRDLLDEAGVDPRADQLVGRAVDGFTTGTPLAAALDGRDALVAVGMNGEPLPVRHGFPARLVIGGFYGYVSATKWLTEIELTRFDRYDAYWIERDWALPGPVKLASRIDMPWGGVAIKPERTPVAGYAWAQGRGIARVEVRVDRGPWHEAELATAVGVDTWRQWRWFWDATPGRHVLECRATGLDGEVQTDERRPPFPDGATGIHAVQVDVQDR